MFPPTVHEFPHKCKLSHTYFPSITVMISPISIWSWSVLESVSYSAFISAGRLYQIKEHAASAAVYHTLHCIAIHVFTLSSEEVGHLEYFHSRYQKALPCRSKTQHLLRVSQIKAHSKMVFKCYVMFDLKLLEEIISS